MFARYQINLNTISSATTATTINIPLDMDFQLVGQDELIQTQFVDLEVEKAINPIMDYEKTRFSPVSSNSNIVRDVTYKLNFLVSGSIPSITYYGNIGYTDDDIKFRKSNFMLSFLRLDFYDTDKGTNQRLLSFITVYPKITSANLQPLSVSPPLIPSTVKPALQIPISFTLSNPIINPEGFAEGYYIYNYKDEVTSTLPKELFMRASYNNAKNGKTTNLMTEGVAYGIDNLVNKLYTKYILKRNTTGFFYEVDPTYSNNVTINSNNITINLYQIQTL